MTQEMLDWKQFLDEKLMPVADEAFDRFSFVGALAITLYGTEMVLTREDRKRALDNKGGSMNGPVTPGTPRASC